MTIKNSTVETFLEELASKASTPGGGSAAAIMGGVSAALSSMVCNLTIGKKKFAAVEAEMSEILVQADNLRARMIYAIEEDVAAFNEVMAAYGLPKASEDEQKDRHQAIQLALRSATDAPLECAKLCREAIELAAHVSEKGNPAVVSDGGVAALAGQAALRSSALNVYVNAKVIEDRVFADDRLQTLETLLSEGSARAEATYEAVKKQLS